MIEFTPLPEQPLVSVIIPSYNSRKWVGKAIDSLLEQTFTNLEIIVVDDGSTDDTAHYLEENYKDKIKYIYQRNGGLSNARNTGLKNVKGQLIQFLDADDWLLPGKIEKQVTFLKEHPQYAVAYSLFWRVYDTNPNELLMPVGIDEKKISGDILSYLTHQNVFAVHTALVRKECLEVVGNFYEFVSSYEDLDLWLRIAGTGFLFGYYDARDSVYLFRKSSLTRNSHNMRLNRFRVYAHARQVIPPERLNLALKNNLYAASFEFGAARALFERRKFKAGFNQFIFSLKAKHPRRFLYTIFSFFYLGLLLILGYSRFERLISYLINFYNYRLSHL